MALLAVIIYVGIIDRVGRRWPVCIAYTILTVCLWLIGALYYAQTAASGTVLVSSSGAETLLGLIGRSRNQLTLPSSFWSASGSLASRCTPRVTTSSLQNCRLFSSGVSCLFTPSDRLRWKVADKIKVKTGTFVWFYQALWGIVLT